MRFDAIFTDPVYLFVQNLRLTLENTGLRTASFHIRNDEILSPNCVHNSDGNILQESTRRVDS